MQVYKGCWRYAFVANVGTTLRRKRRTRIRAATWNLNIWFHNRIKWWWFGMRSVADLGVESWPELNLAKWNSLPSTRQIALQEPRAWIWELGNPNQIGTRQMGETADKQSDSRTDLLEYLTKTFSIFHIVSRYRKGIAIAMALCSCSYAARGQRNKANIWFDLRAAGYCDSVGKSGKPNTKFPVGRN